MLQSCLETYGNLAALNKLAILSPLERDVFHFVSFRCCPTIWVNNETEVKIKFVSRIDGTLSKLYGILSKSDLQTAHNMVKTGEWNTSSFMSINLVLL